MNINELRVSLSAVCRWLPWALSKAHRGCRLSPQTLIFLFFFLFGSLSTINNCIWLLGGGNVGPVLRWWFGKSAECLSYKSPPPKKIEFSPFEFSVAQNVRIVYSYHIKKKNCIILVKWQLFRHTITTFLSIEFFFFPQTITLLQK